MEIFVISLLRSEERRRTFEARNGHLQFRYFDAVDGRANETSLRGDRSFILDGVPYTPGALGAAASHKALWLECQRLNAPITIAEDDAIFRRDFCAEADRLVSRIGVDWDIILWGWNFDTILEIGDLHPYSGVVMRFGEQSLRDNIEKFVESTTATVPLKLIKTFGLPAYSLTPCGAGKLIEFCFPLTRMRIGLPTLGKNIDNYGIDVAMAYYYRKMKSFCSFPPIAVSMNLGEGSTIQPQGDIAP